MDRHRVLHLVGSPVDEFHAELSRLYAAACLTALAGEPYDVHIAHVDPGDRWSFPADLSADARAAAAVTDRAHARHRLTALGIDVMVPQMFCLPGMTEYRTMFEELGIPYLGNPAAVMAAAADKTTAREIVSAAGVAVPDGRVVRDDTPTNLALPVVVKPAASDNSVGVSLVREAREYGPAVREALTHGGVALVESYVPLGREVRCGVVVRDGELVCLPLEEYAVDSATKPIRDGADKLARTDAGDLFLVAKERSRAWIVPTDDPVTDRVWELARRSHEALGCRHYSLFDVRIDPAGQPWFLEAGPYCSFAPTSVVAVMAGAAGISVQQLFADALAELDWERNPTCVSPR